MSGHHSRIAWSLVDQGISSGSNYLLLILLIRFSTLAELGGYGLAYTTYFLFQACARGLASEPLTVRVSPSDPMWETDRREAAGASLAGSLLMALGAAGVAVVTDEPLSQAWLALAICLPGLILQDMVRMVLFAERRMRSAALNDLLFLLVQLLTYAPLLAAGHVSGFWLFLGWGVGAYAAGAAGLAQARLWPRLLSTWSWLRRHRDIIPAYVGDYAANRGTEQLTLIGVFAAAGAPAVGIVTAARTLFAPLTTIQTGLNGFALPEAARLHRTGGERQLRALVLSFAACMVVLMVAGGVALALVPTAWGEAVMSANWSAAIGVLWPMCVFSALNAAGFALWLGSKARQRAQAVFVVRLASGLVMVVAASLGARFADATGAVVGMSAAAAVLVVGMALLLRESDSP